MRAPRAADFEEFFNWLILQRAQREAGRRSTLPLNEEVWPMGRGRSKAKQTKVARKLKYSGGGTDLERLRRELGVQDSTAAGPVEADPIEAGPPTDAPGDDDGDRAEEAAEYVAADTAGRDGDGERGA
jgi:hypothetical protein